MEEWEQSLQAEISNLRELYIEALAQRRKELDLALAAYLDAPADAAAWTSLRDLAHRLRGSAGSYGFGRISLAAEQVEDWLSAHRNRAFENSDDRDAIQALVRTLLSEIDHPELDEGS